MYDIKPTFQRALKPLCLRLHRAGVTPNQLTVATLAASLAMGFWLYAAPEPSTALAVLPVLLLLRMAANALDGMIAKAFNLGTPAGAMLNEVADVLADAALYLPFAVLPGVSAGLVVAVVVLAAATEVAGLASAAAGGGRCHDGPMGKSDRALVFGVLAIVHVAGLRDHRIWDTCLSAVLLLLALTIVNRCRHGARRAG